MEASDPFGAGAPTVEDDPFAETEGSTIEEEPATPDTGLGDPGEGKAEPEPPVVDREGRRVDGPEAAQEPAPEPPAPEPAQEPAGAAEPAAPAEGDRPKQATTERLYKLLYQSGPGQWAEAPMDEAPDGAKQVKDGEVWLRARNADHARRMAFLIFGKPEDGVTVVPVAQSSWKPKRVRRRPPQPDKEALEIS